MVFICFIIIVLALFLRIYAKWDYKKKFTCKIVLIYLSFLGTVLCMLLVLFTVRDVLESEYDASLAKRIDRTEYSATYNKNYLHIAFQMQYDKNYEPEFEYVWERLRMAESATRYQVYHMAAGRMPQKEVYAEQADKFREKLLTLYRNSTYRQNIPYGEYYLERTGLSGAQ